MTSATPNIPNPEQSNSANGIRIADPDIILFENETLPIEQMADLIFEDIGGQEIISVSRNDIVNGQSVAYRPIKNLSRLALKYNSQNLVPLQDSSKTFFQNFPIKLEQYIPESGEGPNGESVYIDQSTGDLVINILPLDNDERVEVEILRSGTILDDTIYTEES